MSNPLLSSPDHLGPATSPPRLDLVPPPVDTPLHGAWDPVCVRPRDLSWPRRVGRAGADGLTWRVANGPRHERVAPGWYVPRDRSDSVEQRVVDAAARLPADCSRGAVTAWSALRWHGAAYFDGRGAHGGEELPVVLATGGDKLTPVAGTRVMQHALAPSARACVDGLPVTTVQRALFDEIRRVDDLWAAVQAIDMAAAAGLISVWLFACYLAEANGQPGIPLARRAVALAVDESRSPRETWLRLVWLLLAGLPPPLVNTPLFTLDGRFLAKPDLFDPESGLAVEYGGVVHLDHRQRRADLARESDIRAHGLGYVEVVRGDSRSDACDRLLAARSRAPFLAPDERRWTLVPPAGWAETTTLDARLVAAGRAASLVCH